MHFDTDRIINILIVAALALVILIFLVFFCQNYRYVESL